MKSWILPILLLSAFAVAAAAQEFPQYQDVYVNDFAGIFTADEVSQLKSVLAEVRQNTTAEVVVVTVETVAPLTPSEYATELFTEWGIGKEENDNGLLLLYAKNENKLWVTTGYGMEGILPDSKLGRMLDEYYVPLRDSGNVTSGIILFTEEVSGVIIENREEVIAGNRGGGFIDSLLSNPFLQNFFIPAFFMALPFFMIFGFLILGGLAFIIATLGGMVLTPKCSRDGLRMRFVRYEGSYAVYICPNGHETRKKRRTRSAFASGGFAAGGFGGGGFGGGGFGGGGTGGGGAGR